MLIALTASDLMPSIIGGSIYRLFKQKKIFPVMEDLFLFNNMLLDEKLLDIWLWCHP